MAKQLQIAYHELPGLTVIAMLSFYHRRSVLSNPLSFFPSTAANKHDVSVIGLKAHIEKPLICPWGKLCKQNGDTH